MKKLLWATTVVLGALGALLGWRAGAFFARENFTVQLAAVVASEDAAGQTQHSLESSAFRDSGRPLPELYGEAARIVKRFRAGSALLGAFCGLALGVQLLGQTRVPRSRIYFIDQDDCVSCARCFLACPRERLRLKKLKPCEGSSNPSQGLMRAEPCEGLNEPSQGVTSAQPRNQGHTFG